MSSNPAATPARFPAKYGQSPTAMEELLAWSDVADRIAALPNYWLATTTDDDRPYLRPVDGVFVDATLAFGGSPTPVGCGISSSVLPSRSACPTTTMPSCWRRRRARDRREPAGRRPRQRGQRHKYPQYHTDGAAFLPFWALRPRRVYAWTLTGFPNRATRFDFEPLASRSTPNSR